MTQQEWSPVLVEDLLFRRFMKNEDISALIPPTPPCDVDGYLQLFDQTSKSMSQYVRNGPPVAPFSSHNPNVQQPTFQKSNPVTPHKGNFQQYTPPPPLSTAGAKTPMAKSAVSAPFPSEQPAQKPVATLKTPTVASSSSNMMRDAVPPPAPQTLSSMPPPPSPSAVLAKRDRLEAGTPKGGKKVRIDWPADVPTNVVLKSKSRSAVAHLTTARVRAQQCFDPDMVFQQPKGELPLHTIFANFPQALKLIAAVRGTSGDWRDDTFTPEEETIYKKEVGIVYFGPSQCIYGTAAL
jgi:hypothetical protein